MGTIVSTSLTAFPKIHVEAVEVALFGHLVRGKVCFSGREHHW